MTSEKAPPPVQHLLQPGLQVQDGLVAAGPAVEAGAVVVDDLVLVVLLLVVLTAGAALGGGAQHGVRRHGGVTAETAAPGTHQCPLEQEERS